MSTRKAATVTPDVVHIAPARGWRSVDLADIWRHRELLYFLTWRDIKVRYKQTALGAAWAVLQPFLTMLIFSVFFGHLAKVPSEGVPYPVFSFTALVPWMFFANALALGANSLVVTPELVTKIYFPRVMMPAATILAGLVDFAIAFVVLIAMVAYYGIVPGPESLLVVPLLLLAVMTAFGVALWLAALNVEYRDVRYALPFIVQLWLFATPIAYPSSLVHGPWRLVLGINPMAGVVEGFRWALLGTTPAPGPMIIVSVIAALVLLTSGLWYFQRVEGRFADVI
ncbi:MAG TPA: ABC transporter permease [Acidimicrobiia bacterium]|nr:ABC transporter permease [Acidimicrobiia bacterium]